MHAEDVSVGAASPARTARPQSPAGATATATYYSPAGAGADFAPAQCGSCHRFLEADPLAVGQGPEPVHLTSPSKVAVVQLLVTAYPGGSTPCCIPSRRFDLKHARSAAGENAWTVRLSS
ncbi:hypothetical protein GCM10027259_51970 [Micromonospora palomenae]